MKTIEAIETNEAVEINEAAEIVETREAAETVETTTIRIPVKNLVLSPLYVRKKQGPGIEELAALIASQGLIHNLVVTGQAKKGRKSGK